MKVELDAHEGKNLSSFPDLHFALIHFTPILF